MLISWQFDPDQITQSFLALKQEDDTKPSRVELPDIAVKLLLLVEISSG